MPSATMRRSRVRTSDKNAVRISMARTLSSSTGRTLPTFEAKPILPRAERTIVSLVPATPLFVRQFVPWSSTSVSSAALECDRHVRSPPGLVHEGDDVAVRERLPFEPGDRSIGPPAVVRHGGAVQAPQVLDPAATLPILQNPRVMLRQVPFRIQDPDLGRAPEALLRATLVAQLVVPADLHLPLDLALLPEHDEMRKPEGLLGPSGDCLGHVLGA